MEPNNVIVYLLALIIVELVICIFILAMIWLDN